MQNLIILFTLSLIQTLSVTFLTAAVIIILVRVQKCNTSIKAVTNVFVASVLTLAISTALILNIDFENLKQWMFFFANRRFACIPQRCITRRSEC